MKLAMRFLRAAAVVLALAAAASPVLAVNTDALLRNQIGDTYFAQGDFESAAREYREAVRLAPDYARARYNLATVLDLKMGRGPEALEHYRAFLSLSPVPLEIVDQRIAAIQEGLDYTALMGHVTIEAAETYVSRYPQGKHIAEVRDVLSRLIDNRRKEEEAAREQQRRELEALGTPDVVERWAWLWRTWEIRWYHRSGVALIYSGGQLKRKVTFAALDRQDDERIAAVRTGIVDQFTAERTAVVVATAAKMTTSGLLDHIYLSARDKFRAEGSYLPVSAAFDRSLRELVDTASVLEPSEFVYTKKNDITGEETKVAMPGYRARCDIGTLPVIPVGILAVPAKSSISRIRIGDEAINVLAGQTIPLPADRYRVEVWAGSTMARQDVTLEAQQTVVLSEPQ